MENTGIEYADHSWNPWTGCHPVSTGCDHCYMYRGKRRFGKDPAIVVRSKPATFKKPLKWKEPARVFVCSWSDFFIEEADAWRADAWDIIRLTPHLTYIIVTKRPERIEKCLPDDWCSSQYGNVWLVATTENQEMADTRMPYMLDLKDKGLAHNIGLSIEPMLGPVDLKKWLIREKCLNPECDYESTERSSEIACQKCTGEWFLSIFSPPIDWVAIGAESGPDKRYCFSSDIQSVVNQCIAAKVPVYVKQIHNVSLTKIRLSKKMDEWPEGLRVRQFPEVEKTHE